MTEEELREHLAAEERKLTERQQQAEAEQEKSRNARSSDTDVAPPIPTDHGAQNAPDPERLSQRNTDRQKQTEPERVLTEVELREVLSRGVQELNKAEKQRRRGVPNKTKDDGMDFSFE